MSEQELYMMGDERGKDEPSAGQLVKKHDTIEAAIADYAETVNELGERARGLTDSGHPERYQYKFVAYYIRLSLLVSELQYLHWTSMF